MPARELSGMLGNLALEIKNALKPLRQRAFNIYNLKKC